MVIVRNSAAGPLNQRAVHMGEVATVPPGWLRYVRITGAAPTIAATGAERVWYRTTITVIALASERGMARSTVHGRRRLPVGGGGGGGAESTSGQDWSGGSADNPAIGSGPTRRIESFTSSAQEGQKFKRSLPSSR